MWNLHQQWWCDLSTPAIGREPARAHFYPFEDARAAMEGDRASSSRVTCLSGDWRFKWLCSPLLVDEAVTREPADAAHGYADIRVPRNWQFAGYGRMLYTDEAFPFPLDPPYIPAENETGVYKRTFSWRPSARKRLFLRFEGVESAFSVYLNGVFIGYSQGSRLPSEFEVTAHAQAENELCVVVYQYCDGTYLEDQDMWWLGGIIRDVLLLERPESYLADWVCHADYDAGTREGVLEVCVQVRGGAEVTLTLRDPAGNVVAESPAQSGVPVRISVPKALAWNAEEPHLYQIIATAMQNGEVLEAVSQRVGFRRVEISDGTLLLNGRRIMLRGVNRHEFDPQNGRAVSEELTREELLLIKRAGINAIRTSHYPNIPAFYDLCDQIGLYVLDECDLETHGFEIEGDPTRLANDPEWTAAYVERAERMVARDRNHACVIMWSLGNEASYGQNFREMRKRIREMDPSRPVHYEPDVDCDSADVSSSMYTSIGMLHERDLEQTPKRPHILCEFAHAMGNGPGGLQQYIETCENSARIQGYFLWELKDHGIYTRREDGTVYHRFGGDFGEDYTSGNFCMDGLLFADGTPSPGFYEYKHLVAPIQISGWNGDAKTVCLKSRWDFATLEGALLHCVLRRDDAIVQEWSQPLPSVKAQETQTIALPTCGRPDAPGLWTLTLSCHLEQPTPWGTAGQVVGDGHFVLENACPQSQNAQGRLDVSYTSSAILLSSKRCSFAISLVDGRIHDYVYDGSLRLQKGPMLNFFRAYVDNDRKLCGTWQEQHLHSMCMTVHTADVTQCEQHTRAKLTGTFSPNGRNWQTQVEIIYDMDAEGQIRVSFEGLFVPRRGSQIPSELPKLGTASYLPKECATVTYCGMGPRESYCDSQASARKGIYTSSVEALQVPYECPQDNGNRTGVEFAAIANPQGIGLVFASLTPRDMSVRAQEDKELWQARHAHDVSARDYHVFHFDAQNAGLGSASCGPNHLRQHAVMQKPFAFSFALAPLSGENIIDRARLTQGFLLGLE